MLFLWTFVGKTKNDIKVKNKIKMITITIFLSKLILKQISFIQLKKYSTKSTFFAYNLDNGPLVFPNRTTSKDEYIWLWHSVIKLSLGFCLNSLVNISMVEIGQRNW